MYAIYYDGVLIGVISNPSAYPGGIEEICHMLSPNDGLAEARQIAAEIDDDDDQ